MSTLRAYSDLLRMGKPILTTRDAALRLRVSSPEACRLLSRLQKEGFALRIFRGLWTLDTGLDPLAVPPHLTAPFPAYVSLWTALHLHAIVSQIPQIVYAATPGPTRRVVTTLGTYSLHRLAPAFFGGYGSDVRSGVLLATPEKSLLDLLYLTPARSRLFAHPPEISLPKRFRIEEARRWIGRIRDPLRQKMVRARLDAILGRRA